MIRSAKGGLAVVAACAVVAAPAFAHTSVKSRSPGKNKTVERASRVSVTFRDQIRSGRLVVRTRSGRRVGSGGLSSSNVRKLVARTGSLRRGRYKASYTFRAIDGHTQKGSWRFRVR